MKRSIIVTSRPHCEREDRDSRDRRGGRVKGNVKVLMRVGRVKRVCYTSRGGQSGTRQGTMPAIAFERVSKSRATSGTLVLTRGRVHARAFVFLPPSGTLQLAWFVFVASWSRGGACRSSRGRTTAFEPLGDGGQGQRRAGPLPRWHRVGAYRPALAGPPTDGGRTRRRKTLVCSKECTNEEQLWPRGSGSMREIRPRA